MNRDRIVRTALGLSVFFNLFGAGLFAFPGSPLGEFVGLPEAVPVIYRGVVAFFVVLFGGAYGWLALQAVIDRPMVGFAAIGKTGFFLLVLVFFLIGEASGLALGAASGDLLFAGVFGWWVWGGRP